jgi:hypothetical protein
MDNVAGPNKTSRSKIKALSIVTELKVLVKGGVLRIQSRFA